MKSSPESPLELQVALNTFLVDLGKEYLAFNPQRARDIGERLREAINTFSLEHSGNLTDYISENINVTPIKFAQIQSILPKPIDTDSSIYKNVYASFNELQKRHLLGLRFGLRGDTSLNQMSLALPVSHREFLIHSMQDSFKAFHQNSGNYLNSQEFGISKKDLSQIMDNILKNVMLTDPAETVIDSILANGDNFSLMYFTGKSPGHWTSIVASNNTVVFANRSTLSRTEPTGITICEMPSEYSHSDVTRLLNSFREQSYFHPISTREHKLNIENNYRHLAKIPLSPQKSDNCGWTSGAKTIIYSNAILCFQKHFKNAGLSNEEALNKAIACSKILYHKWAHDFDRVESLRSYIDFHKQNTNPLIAPDLIELGEILLQSEQKIAPYRIEVAKILNESGLISDENKVQAGASLLANIKKTLENDKINSKKKVKKYLTLYLSEKGTQAADEFLLMLQNKKIEKEKAAIAARTEARFLGPTFSRKLIADAKLTVSDFQELTEEQRTNLSKMYDVLSDDLIIEKLYFKELTLSALGSLNSNELANLNLLLACIKQDNDYKFKVRHYIHLTDLISLQVTPDTLTHIMELHGNTPQKVLSKSDLETIVSNWKLSEVSSSEDMTDIPNSPSPKPKR